MNKSVYSYNCVIFPGKLRRTPAFGLAFVGEALIRGRWPALRGACSLNGAIWSNFQTRWRWRLRWLRVGWVYRVAAIVQSDTLCWNRFWGGGVHWHVGPPAWAHAQKDEKNLDARPLNSAPAQRHANPSALLGGEGGPDQHLRRLEISNGGPERHSKLLKFFFFLKKVIFISGRSVFGRAVPALVVGEDWRGHV